MNHVTINIKSDATKIDISLASLLRNPCFSNNLSYTNSVNPRISNEIPRAKKFVLLLDKARRKAPRTPQKEPSVKRSLRNSLYLKPINCWFIYCRAHYLLKEFNAISTNAEKAL